MKISTINKNLGLNIYRFFTMGLILLSNLVTFRKLLYLLILLWLSFAVNSCKTCKCPAYSQIESQITTNTGDTIV